MLYAKIFIENVPVLVPELDRQFPNGFTFIPAIGRWQGAEEKSAVIDIIVDISVDDLLGKAEQLRSACTQQSVYLVITNLADSTSCFYNCTADSFRARQAIMA